MKIQSSFLMIFFAIASQSAHALTIKCVANSKTMELGGVALVEIMNQKIDQNITDHTHKITAYLQMPPTCTGNVVTFTSIGKLMPVQYTSEYIADLYSNAYINRPAQGHGSMEAEWEIAKDMGRITLTPKGNAITVKLSVDDESPLDGLVQTLECNGDIEAVLK